MSLLWWKTSAWNVRNLFYNFVSLPSFHYILFMFNTVYTALQHSCNVFTLMKDFSLKCSSVICSTISSVYHLFYISYSRLTLSTQHHITKQCLSYIDECLHHITESDICLLWRRTQHKTRAIQSFSHFDSLHLFYISNSRLTGLSTQHHITE